MYVPKSFQQTDLETLYEFVERHSFATLISQQNGEPFASHLPLLLDRRGDGAGRLVGHMARANPQWREAAGQQVLAIFHGPHAYVSPAWYEAEAVVPTWNYVTVHAYGPLRILDDASAVRELLDRTVRVYEAPRAQPWALETAPEEFVSRMLEAIVAFEIPLARLEGKWKLSQNHPRERQEKVIRGLRAEPTADGLAVAALMEMPPGSSAGR